MIRTTLMSGAGGLEPLSRAETMADRAEDTLGPPPEKPPYSYVALITLVLEESPDRRLTLSSIYEAIQRRFPYYSRLEGKSWQNSIRHNLSLNECFIRLPRQPGQKGSHWALHPEYRDMFPQRDYRRRRRLAALPPFRYQLPPGHYPLISGPWRPGPPFYFTGPPPHLYPSQGEMPSPPYWDPELQYGAMVPTRMEVYPQHPLPPCGFRSLLSCEHDKEEVPTSSDANPDPLL